jgi:phosphoglycolate phosphatase
MRKYDLAIFDMDGTILDSGTDIADSLNVVLARNGFPAYTTREVCLMVGNGVRKLIECALPKDVDAETFERVYEEYSTYYKAHCAIKTAPYEGIPRMLAALRAAGIKTAVYSNKMDAAVKTMTEKYFGGLFDYALGQRDGVPVKPAPDGVFDVLAALGVPAARAVYVGDSEVDVKTSINAGTDGVFVSYGFREKATLIAAGGVKIADTVGDLENYLL